MPILKREPDLLPEDLFDLPADRWPWWVAHVRSRRVAFLPLFPGYVFVRGDLEHERLEVLKTNLCVNVLAVLDQEGLGADLAQVRRLQESGLPLLSHPELTEGSLVRIAAGAFAGMTGRVSRLRGKDRFVVAVRFIHRSVSVEVNRDDLEPEPPPRATRR